MDPPNADKATRTMIVLPPSARFVVLRAVVWCGVAGLRFESTPPRFE